MPPAAIFTAPAPHDKRDAAALAERQARLVAVAWGTLGLLALLVFALRAWRRLRRGLSGNAGTTPAS